ncbi:hypothetical protein CCACVL1_26835 [Corchorus capsularis]|uniref:Uncharacterized protein n=1 Tax=Corchorus capsularis TaxID=210143 RepID=A0A1R3GD47_COCAP|nr:hypothetical protein CCACVL1_26835 [Corchorus capsularis]
MRERQKEKLKRMEEERVRRGEIPSHEERKAAAIAGRSKVHPGNFVDHSASGNESNNAA